MNGSNGSSGPVSSNGHPPLLDSHQALRTPENGSHGVLWDIWRVDTAGFLDRVSENVRATSGKAAIRRARTRDDATYLALRSEVTQDYRNSNGDRLDNPDRTSD